MTQVPLNLAGLLIVVVYLPASVPPARATDDNASAATTEAATASFVICVAAKAPPRGTICFIVFSFVVWSAVRKIARNISAPRIRRPCPWPRGVRRGRPGGSSRGRSGLVQGGAA